MLLFLIGSFHELANFKYQAQKLCDSFICIFSVFVGQKCCVTAALHVPPIRAGMRDTCMNPDVEFTVFSIVFHELLVLLSILKQKQNILQGSYTILEFNT